MPVEGHESGTAGNKLGTCVLAAKAPQETKSKLAVLGHTAEQKLLLLLFPLLLSSLSYCICHLAVMPQNIVATSAPSAPVHCCVTLPTPQEGIAGHLHHQDPSTEEWLIPHQPPKPGG